MRARHLHIPGRLWAALLALVVAGAAAPAAIPHPPGVAPAGWTAAVLAARAGRQVPAGSADAPAAPDAGFWEGCRQQFPVPCDWVEQDFGSAAGEPFASPRPPPLRPVLDRILSGLGGAGVRLRRRWEALERKRVPDGEGPWVELYVDACRERRRMRLKTVLATAPRMVFTKRRTTRPSFFAYTEGQSDAQHERHFLPGSELCLLELDGPEARVRTLLADPAGVIRDPAVSWDGQRVLFAWKKSLNDDDYHLYELHVATGWLRQLTFGLGHADYEPAYLPDEDIVFASTRCVQRVDCWWTEVSNLYTCDPDGRYLRRLGFDQVHTVFPQVLDDGRVIYTRWDYNDRGQVYPQALFQMHADGTGQTEFYGNNSWFPTTMAHARGIPGTTRVMAILCGHHTSQAGKLAIIDPALGRHENQGVQLVAPVRPTPAERIDAYGQHGDLWQYPYPLNQREFLVTYAPRGWEPPSPANQHRDDAAFAIYWMDVDGRRELLAADPRLPCQQPVPLTPRRRPPQWPQVVDYRETNGACYVQDVHVGSGLAGIPRGTVVKLRVVALAFSPAGIGNNGNAGPAGAALVSTPVSVGNGSWDVKVVLGDTRVHPDGSAFFAVPARTPLYFQALDAHGHAVQTMRSWTTLQPGETQSCVGCHEHKNSAPPTAPYRGTLALKSGPQALAPFHGPPRGFSFPKEIQPILDRHCTRCHHDRSLHPEIVRLEDAAARETDPDWTRSPAAALRARARPAADAPPHARPGPPDAAAAPEPARPAFSLLSEETVDPGAKRRWSDAYLNLTLAQPDGNEWARGAFRGVYDGRMVNWIGAQSIPTPLPPCAAGACTSALFPLLARGHYGVVLNREELDKLACWIDLLVPYCGDYAEASVWTPAEQRKYARYLAKQQRMEALERVHLDALPRRRAASATPATPPRPATPAPR
ncbi:MAG: hypothetical protein JXQ71_08315 [Verrucomicrobia bacterium]|nr:hypothetical protein [Verrucomicrobiota bacterium]